MTDAPLTTAMSAVDAGGDGDAQLIVTADGLVIDTGGATMNGFVLSSEAGIFTGDAAYANPLEAEGEAWRETLREARREVG